MWSSTGLNTYEQLVFFCIMTFAVNIFVKNLSFFMSLSSFFPLFLSLSLCFSTASNFVPFSKEQPDSSDLNHCILLQCFNPKITGNVLMNLDP